MRARQLIVYALVLAVLGGFYYLWEVRFEKSRMELAERESLVFGLDPEKVERLTITRPDQEEITLERRAGGWIMTAPVNTPLEDYLASEMVTAAARAEIERRLGPAQDLAPFGLDAPSLSLTLSARGKALAPTLELGGLNPAGILRYARLAGQGEVFTVGAGLFKTLDKSVFELRDKALLLLDKDEIEALRVQGPKGAFTLTKKGEDWFITTPNLGRADADKVRELFTYGLKARVARFLPYPGDGSLDFERPVLTIKALAGDMVRAELDFGKKTTFTPPAEADPYAPPAGPEEGWVVLGTQRAEAMLVGQEAFETLNLDPQDLADRHVSFFDRAAVAHLELARGETRMNAQKQEGYWKIKGRDWKTQDEHLVTFLMDLEDLEYADEIPATEENLAAWGLDGANPLEITLFDADRKVIHAYRLGLEDRDGVAAIAPDSGPPLLIGAGFLKKLPPDFRPGGQD